MLPDMEILAFYGIEKYLFSLTRKACFPPDMNSKGANDFPL
jgi:hypothetical protein